MLVENPWTLILGKRENDNDVKVFSRHCSIRACKFCCFRTNSGVGERSFSLPRRQCRAAWPTAAASWWSRRRPLWPRLPGSHSWGQACWCKIGPFQLETEKTVKVIACWRKKNGRRLSRFLNCYQTIWWLVAAPEGPEGHGPPRFWQISSPYLTRGADHAHNYMPPRFSDLPKALVSV